MTDDLKHFNVLVARKTLHIVKTEITYRDGEDFDYEVVVTPDRVEVYFSEYDRPRVYDEALSRALYAAAMALDPSMLLRPTNFNPPARPQPHPSAQMPPPDKGQMSLF